MLADTGNGDLSTAGNAQQVGSGQQEAVVAE